MAILFPAIFECMIHESRDIDVVAQFKKGRSKRVQNVAFGMVMAPIISLTGASIDSTLAGSPSGYWFFA